MKDKEKQEKVFDILNKFEFFQGQRAGRELWNNKSKEVQDKDISDFIKDINYIRSYLQDSVVLSREEYESLKARADDKCKYDCWLIEDVPDFEVEKDIKTQSSKETAEKILDLLVPDCKACDENWHRGCLCLRATLAEKIAKQFGVE